MASKDPQEQEPKSDQLLDALKELLASRGGLVCWVVWTVTTHPPWWAACGVLVWIILRGAEK